MGPYLPRFHVWYSEKKGWITDSRVPKPPKVVIPPKIKIKLCNKYSWRFGWVTFQDEFDCYYYNKHKKVRLYYKDLKSKIKCTHCEVNHNLTFHHLEKDDYKNPGKCGTIKRLQKELKKGIFLCEACHDIIHRIEDFIFAHFNDHQKFGPIVEA